MMKLVKGILTIGVSCMIGAVLGLVACWIY